MVRCYTLQKMLPGWLMSGAPAFVFILNVTALSALDLQMPQWVREQSAQPKLAASFRQSESWKCCSEWLLGRALHLSACNRGPKTLGAEVGHLQPQCSCSWLDIFGSMVSGVNTPMQCVLLSSTPRKPSPSLPPPRLCVSAYRIKRSA